jgi:diguanylate cyclase (GGDEF)-like protein
MQSLAVVEVSDASGKPFVRWQRHGVEDFATTSGVARIMWLGPVRQDIEFRGQKVGSVVVTGSLDSIIQYALSGLVIALCCLGITVIATRMLARQLQESIAGPFDRVAEIAHEASSERRLSSRLDPTGVVEIDRFASDFNSLIAELESWHATLTSENAELSRRADHDPLTGLGNRARFERLFEAAIKVAEKSGKQVALLFVDCDGFKEINDRHGHDVGDAVICTIAERLRHSIRERDRVFRLGGDEFAVVLDNLVSLDAVDLVADRVRASMDEPVTVGLGQEHRLSLSIGHASYPEDGNTPRLLVRVADQRMYRVKRGEKTSENDNA